MKKFIIASMMLCFGLGINAQTEEYKIEPLSHWYIQAQVGGQYTLGEADFTDLLSPNVQLGVGYQYNPWFGLRLSANAWQSMGGWTNPTNTYKWNYVAPSLDFIFNLSNAIGGFNPNRVVNISAFIGAGANIAWGNDEANKLSVLLAGTNHGSDLRYLWQDTEVRGVARGGLQVDFRLSDRVSLGLEANANVLDDHYNSKRAHNADWYFNALAGIKVALGKTYNKVKIEQPVVAEPEPVVVEKIVEKIVEVPAAKEPLREDVFFTINSTVITPDEMLKVQNIANYLNKNADAKVSITGYADAGTGNDRINARLAQLRSEAVVAALKEKYNIPASRITFDSKGDTVQPFAQNDMNRVSICIAE